jgi:hypothetical protein
MYLSGYPGQAFSINPTACPSARDVPIKGEPVPEDKVGNDVRPVNEDPTLSLKRLGGEECDVDGGRGRCARTVDDHVKVVPPHARRVHEPVARVPHLRMLAGADLVVEVQYIQVLLNPQVESAQISSGDELHEVVASVVGGNEEPAGPVPLADGADQAAAGVAHSKVPRRRVEPIAGDREALPIPVRGRVGVESPQFCTGADIASA